VKEQIEQIDRTIQVRDAEPGLFLWINFRSILHDISFDEEFKLFQTMFKHGVYITNGKTFKCSEPGWFRLVFTVKDQMIDEGIKRMKKALNAYRLSSVE
jgi:bifunctional pyridoxal-dependent enzyme with beta-cystathionase and maltose regulon repressor activities